MKITELQVGDHISCREHFSYMFTFRKGEIFRIVKIVPDLGIVSVKFADTYHVVKVGTKLKYSLEFYQIEQHFKPITIAELRKLKLQKLQNAK